MKGRVCFPRARLLISYRIESTRANETALRLTGINVDSYRLEIRLTGGCLYAFINFNFEIP